VTLPAGTPRGGAAAPGTSRDADLQEVDPAEVVRAVLSCLSVAAMHGGLAGEAASYLPGERVTGVRVLPGSVEVHVVARWSVPAAELAEQIRGATIRAARGRPVDVVIGDLVLPEAHPAP